MVNYQNVKQEKLGFALTASIVLHLLAIWPGAFSQRTDEVFGNALSVILRPQAASPGETTHRTAPAPASAARAEPEVRTVAAVAESAPDASSRTASPEKAVSGAAEETGSHAAGVSSRAAGEVRGAASAAASGMPQGVDADGVRQYRMALAVEARRFKRYPPRALADEIGGTVEVRIAVAGGQPQEVALARSSGHDSLDQAALEMLRKAAPRTAVPEALRRRAFAVNLPVVFDVASE